MKEIKRAVCLLLCFVMAIGLLPMHANAIDFEVSELKPGEFVEEIVAGDAQEEPLELLANNAASGTMSNWKKVVSLTSGDEIIIGDGNGNYLSRNNTDVTSTEDPAQATKWTVGTASSNGTTYFTLRDGNYYLRPRSGSNTYSLNINSKNTSYRNWSYNSGTGFNYNNRYLRYWNGWSIAENVTSGYGAAYKNSSLTVNFSVTPASTTIGTKDDNKTVNLTPKIQYIDGNGYDQDVDAKDCAISWSSNDTSVATVENGVVTGVSDGTATITAVLSKNDNLPLDSQISVSVEITVSSRTLVSSVLSGNTPVTIDKGGKPDFSKIKLTLTYSEGPDDVITVDNGLTIEGYDVNVIGDHVAKIIYNGTQYGTVLVTVDGNPYEDLDEATDYPKYPEDGAVRIDKHATELDFADTGLVQVELDVAGVSVKQGIDVVLIVDVSNSMGWSLENVKNPNNDQDYEKRAYGNQETKLDHAMDSAIDFADILLKDNNGSATDNTLSFVTFAGFDATFGKTDKDQGLADSLMEVFRKETSIERATNSFNGTFFDKRTNANDTNADYKLTVTDNNNKKLINAVSNRGDTNYDYAFWQATETVNAIKSENEANGQGNREVYIVFMTDGAPSHYNDETRNGSSGRKDQIPTDVNKFYNESASYTQAGWYERFSTNANKYGKTLYELVKGNFTAIGFDLAHGGFSGWQWTQDELVASLKQVAHDTKEIDVHATAEKDDLAIIFADVAKKIKYAGTSANVEDVIDPDFTLQMDSITGTAGQGIGTADVSGYDRRITIKAYDLWTKDETDDVAKIGTRQKDDAGNLLVENIETVTFETLISYDKDNKEIRTIVATSDKKPGESNILSVAADGTVTINAAYFTYIKTPDSVSDDGKKVDGVETFKWKIGNITDKEIALSYLAYLKGSMEGLEEDGLKYTNKEATLDYIDINGDHAQQIFPIPAVAWGGASTAYEFYLVNDAGEPCDRQGNKVPFANRIIITGPYFQELYLNQGEEEIAKEIVAVKVLPAGYTLYDDTAKYTVQTASGNHEGKLEISEPAAGKVQTTKVVSAVTPSYIQSRVAFGVKYNDIPNDAPFLIAPDAVVIDYGKEIIIDVNANNPSNTQGYAVDLIGFSKFYDNIDVTKWFDDTVYSTPFEGTYGTFSLITEGENAGKVSYVPHKMVSSVGKIFCVYRLTKGSDKFYMVTELDVIPATIMYYETDFADGAFSMSTTGTPWNQICTINDSVENINDNVQNDGTIGNGQTYGFDSTYEDDAYLSDGDSWFVRGQGYTSTKDEDGNVINISNTYTTFSFTGTGFDLISRTGTEQGLIKVQVATDANMTNIVRTVSVLNKSESNLELYQIPVVSINNLEHRTYYVKVEVDAAFSNTILPALNRGNQFFFDAVRIYDTAKGNKTAETAYNTDGEANNKLDEVRALLLDTETYATIEGETTGMLYIDRTKGNVEVANYATIGPNNEVYLSKDQAVAFHVDAEKDPASFDIGAKSITGSTAVLEVTIYDSQKNLSWTVTKDIASSTVQFIDLLSATDASASVLNSGAYVVITNTGDGVLSITDLKTAFRVNTTHIEVDALTGVFTMVNGKMETSGSVKPEESFSVSYTVDAYTLDVARMVLTGAEPEVPEMPEMPEVPEKPETPDVDTSFYNIQNVLLKINGSVKNQKCTFTVVTSQKVEDIEIVQNGAELMTARSSFKDKKNGERVWTIDLRMGSYDKYGIFTLTAIGETGVRGESVVVNNVMRR